jgi:hypothetical protein
MVRHRKDRESKSRPSAQPVIDRQRHVVRLHFAFIQIALSDKFQKYSFRSVDDAFEYDKKSPKGEAVKRELKVVFERRARVLARQADPGMEYEDEFEFEDDWGGTKTIARG